MGKDSQHAMSDTARELLQQYVHDVMTFGIGIKSYSISRIEVLVPNRWLIVGVSGLAIFQRNLIERFVAEYMPGWSLYISPGGEE